MRSYSVVLIVGLALTLTIALTTATATAATTVPTHLRGVKLEEQIRYTQTTFTCADGSANIKANMINDDYCDCLDGSDEPGTSACVNSKFWCANTGASSRLLPSSRVNDGVCDCCDGSDEWMSVGGTACRNTCEESGRAAREAALAEIAASEAGLAARATILAASELTLQGHRTKYAKYQALLESRKAKLEEAKIVKDAEEAIENAERAKRAAAAEAAKQAAAPPGDTNNENTAAAAAAASTESTAPLTEAPEGTIEPTYTDAADAPASDAAAAAPVEEKKENFPYPPEYAYQAADDAAKAGDAAVDSEKHVENFPYPAEYAFNADAAAGGEGESGDGETIEPEYTDNGDEEHAEGEAEGEGEHAEGEHEDETEPGAEESETEEEQHHTEYVHPDATATATTQQQQPHQSTDPIGGDDIKSRLPDIVSIAIDTLTRLVVSTLPVLKEVYSTYLLGSLLPTCQAWGINFLYLITSNFDMELVKRRWRKKSWKMLDRFGGGIMNLVATFETQIFGTKRFIRWATKEEDNKKGYKRPSASGIPEFTTTGADAARHTFTSLETKLNRLQKKMDSLKKVLDRDYGVENQFLHMSEKCYELQVKQYIYEVCPYANAKQKEGHSSTSLGTWQGLEQDTKDGKLMMKFTGGQTCWQGPARSLTVKLRCGSVDRLIKVEEPNKCVYEIEMETPAVCNAQHVQILRMNVENGNIYEAEE